MRVICRAVSNALMCHEYTVYSDGPARRTPYHPLPVIIRMPDSEESEMMRLGSSIAACAAANIFDSGDDIS
ncbi:hypothetical protein AAHC03_09186 [Spirometra sp. Aus1]